ncbi:MAG TPA: DNA-binding response regulator [Cellvibrionaceae bacterium]|nr:DNA-binding response regulator [Cellvibrionaceae bacterium]
MYRVLVLGKQISAVANQVIAYFKGDAITDLAQLSDALEENNYRIVVYDGLADATLDLQYCQELATRLSPKALPLLVLTNGVSPEEKLKAFEVGCDDLIDINVATVDEINARITKSIFHRIANEQLQKRLELATETARNAMVDNSDLGANIQFLLAVNDCDNLDQVGQQFFSTIERYGLRCSLQMRSTLGIKDMEAHGMAKDLESQLLFQLKDSSRYIDFGVRTIVNYGRVSLLIKNMPLDDPEKYGAIKDNTFSLLQGLNARILALEDRCGLLEEKESLLKISQDVNSVMSSIKLSYQAVMRQILTEVENAVELIEHRLPHLALNEMDESFMFSVTDQLVKETNEVFNNGLKVDEIFERLEQALQRAVSSIDKESIKLELGSKSSQKGPDKPVELF